jgi:hypothetical protein
MLSAVAIAAWAASPWATAVACTTGLGGGLHRHRCRLGAGHIGAGQGHKGGRRVTLFCRLNNHRRHGGLDSSQLRRRCCQRRGDGGLRRDPRIGLALGQGRRGHGRRLGRGRGRLGLELRSLSRCRARGKLRLCHPNTVGRCGRLLLGLLLAGCRGRVGPGHGLCCRLCGGLSRIQRHGCRLLRGRCAGAQLGVRSLIARAHTEDDDKECVEDHIQQRGQVDARIIAVSVHACVALRSSVRRRSP